MDPADYSYELPDELIAQAPLSERRESRLLYVPADGGAYQERKFADVSQLLRPGDLVAADHMLVTHSVSPAAHSGCRWCKKYSPWATAYLK